MTILIFLIVVILILIAMIRIVPQSNAYVIERLGKYIGTWEVGVHLLIPLIDRIAKKVTLKEQVADFPPQPVITKDNVTMQIDTVVFFKIVDPKLYTYGITNPISAIENLTATTLRNIIGSLELDETLTAREKINSQMAQILDEATDPWGIKVNRVELKNIIPPKAIQESMEKQMKAEREKREQILIAEGFKESTIKKAEADKAAEVLHAEAHKEVMVLEAEGKAEAILKVQEATAEGIKKVKEAGIDSAVLQLKSIETMKDVANGNATKIIIPADLSNLAGAFTALKEAVDTPTPKSAKKPAPSCDTTKKELGEMSHVESTSGDDITGSFLV
jgi:regulator of protease activity HflC (stomatin/prohibitin superfamily)